jgi:hypothetical protein
MFVPAGDRPACGVPADDAENRALRRNAGAKLFRFFINRLLAIVAISPCLALPVCRRKKYLENINLKN